MGRPIGIQVRTVEAVVREEDQAFLLEIPLCCASHFFGSLELLTHMSPLRMGWGCRQSELSGLMCSDPSFTLSGFVIWNLFLNLPKSASFSSLLTVMNSEWAWGQGALMQGRLHGGCHLQQRESAQEFRVLIIIPFTAVRLLIRTVSADRKACSFPLTGILDSGSKGEWTCSG